MRSDPWLNRWLPLIGERARASPILELGCGEGEDTAILTGAGHRVIAIELSAPAIAEARARVPAAQFHRQDIRAPFPVSAGSVGVVVASLSLHYFAWLDTLALANRVRDALSPKGVLLCRLNSTNDHNYGASGHPRIAENLYSVDGELKRFFDRESVSSLFADGWRSLTVEETVIYRYAQPKSVWEMVLERDA